MDPRRDDRPRTLVIDDEKQVRRALCRLLAVWGLTADAAADGTTGLQLFERGAYDLVLTDLIMPGLSGLELIRTLRQRDPRVPVILLTASAADLAGAGQRLGFTLLLKPVDIGGLEAAVRRAVGHGAPARQASR